jgi:hypothetical protein
MREDSIENHLKAVVKAAAGKCIKMHPVGCVGIPDRLVLLPGGIMVLIELKRPKGGVFSAMQDHWYRWLTDNGFSVERLKTKGEIDECIRQYITPERPMGGGKGRHRRVARDT